MRLKALFTLLVIALVVLAASGPASATHVRPAGATPLRNSLVLAQESCTTPNRIHGPSFTFPSCNPPKQTSQWLTAGTPDANGAAANFIGHVRLISGSSPPDIYIDSNVKDVRCLSATSPSVCTPANSAAGPDYVGQLQIQIGMRITDHWNAVAPGGGPDPATVVDIVFPVDVNCTSTVSVSVGSTCAIATSMNALVPSSAPGTKRTVYQIPQRTTQGGITVWDGGMNGTAGASDATLYAEPGVFLP